MGKEKKQVEYTSEYELEGRIPLGRAILLGMQHVLAMFVGNLTPILIIGGMCGLADAGLMRPVLQNAMLIAGIVTLIQLWTIGPVGSRLPIVMGTSSGFIGVSKGIVASCGGGVLAYGAIMGACLIGGLMEGVLGFFLKPLRKFFPALVTGTVVTAIGLSLISVGINSFGGFCYFIQALYKRNDKFCIYFNGNYRRLYCLCDYGIGASNYIYGCRGCCADLFLGD